MCALVSRSDEHLLESLAALGRCSWHLAGLLIFGSGFTIHESTSAHSLGGWIEALESFESSVRGKDSAKSQLGVSHLGETGERLCWLCSLETQSPLCSCTVKHHFVPRRLKPCSCVSPICWFNPPAGCSHRRTCWAHLSTSQRAIGGPSWRQRGFVLHCLQNLRRRRSWEILRVRDKLVLLARVLLLILVVRIIVLLGRASRDATSRRERPRATAPYQIKPILDNCWPWMVRHRMLGSPLTSLLSHGTTRVPTYSRTVDISGPGWYPWCTAHQGGHGRYSSCTQYPGSW